MRFTTWILVLALSGATHVLAQKQRDQLFDDGWLFYRGDSAGAEAPAFNDSGWRKLDFPHDWSIEDLPQKENAVPELDAVAGDWRFREGDSAEASKADFDDSEWEVVTLPNTWESHSNYSDDNSFGWYRRQIKVPDDCVGRDIDVLLGRIDDVDEVWWNGVRIGGTGSFPPDYRSAWDVERRYRLPASLVQGDGLNVLAVRVFDGENNGGIYATGTKSVRIGPFDPQESQGKDKTGYVLGGTSWYRKHFNLQGSHKCTAIRFDGVYGNVDAWINGHHLGGHPYGYTSFEFDLTPYLRPARSDNVLAVRVQNEGKNSRWYSGSGIYRHTWLVSTEPVHIPTYGVFVTTPEVSQERAFVDVVTEVYNGTNEKVLSKVAVILHDPDGLIVGRSEGDLLLQASVTESLKLSVDISEPKLWSPETPHLYSANVKVLSDQNLLDEIDTQFGVRSISVDAQHGFRLNGVPLLLKGGCIHHDNGPLGAASIDRAEERKIELLKSNGFNAIRTSHNPPSPALLAACDHQGILVIEEAFDQWNEQKLDNGEDYHCYFQEWFERDIESMVRRDRNHPSVIMWSIGNEIPEQFRATQTQLALRKTVLRHDETRPVTQAICTDWGDVIRDWDRLSDPAFQNLDIAGYNYLPEKYETDHARHPDRVMYGSESFPKDAFEYWALVERHPYVLGDFVWTAMDYLGESGLAHAVLSNEPNPFFMSWPWHNAWCGDLDICGFKKSQSYYRDVVWHRSPIEMAVHSPIPQGTSEVLSWWAWPDEYLSWNWEGHEGQPLVVSVYSRCDAVRLVLNGKVIGEKPVSADTKLTAKFEVPYEPGELRALGIIAGEIMAETVLKTSGPPQRIALTADRRDISADRNDLSYVAVEIVDAEGQRVSNAATPVHFTVSGVGKLAGQTNGLPNKPTSFQQPVCITEQGRCLVILRPNGRAGDIKLHTTAEGLQSATLVIHCNEATQGIE